MYCPQCGKIRIRFAVLPIMRRQPEGDWQGTLTLVRRLRAAPGPLPKIKDMVKSLKVEHVTEEVSRALERMNKEIIRTSPSSGTKPRKTWWHKKTAAERREKHIVNGTVSLFSGVGLTIFLYYFHRRTGAQTSG